MKYLKRSAVLLLLFSCVARWPIRLGAQGGLADTPQALAGTWVLNRAASEKFPTPDGDGERRGRGRGNGPPPGMGGRGGHGGGRGGGQGGSPGGGRGDADRDARQRVRDLTEEVLTPTPRLIIMPRDATHMTLTDADGHARTYATTGEKEPHQLVNGTVQTKTRWDQGKLVVTVSIDHGPTVVQSYTRDGEQLKVTLQGEAAGGRGAHPSAVVYDAADER